MSNNMVPINVDISLLVEQKAAILRAIDRATEEDVSLLDGVLSLLDYIHDKVDPSDLVNKGDYSDE